MGILPDIDELRSTCREWRDDIFEPSSRSLLSPS